MNDYVECFLIFHISYNHSHHSIKKKFIGITNVTRKSIFSGMAPTLNYEEEEIVPIASLKTVTVLTAHTVRLD